MTTLLIAYAAALAAHSGPPFPIVSDQAAGAYKISLWVDPDATDDGSAAGQFWVMIQLADRSAVPAGTQATVTITPTDRPGVAQSRLAAPVNGEVGRQFAAVVMDHEGPFAVQASISGPRGPAVVRGQVDATYDLRPPRAMLALYVLPFLIVGFLWSKLLIARRRDTRR
jgi:hypothetical protein